MNLIFLCAAKDRPIGGIKVIHQIASIADRLLIPQGGSAFICHPNHPSFRVTWFDTNVRYRPVRFGLRLRPKPGLTRIRLGTFDPRQDIVVIPELWVRKYAAQLAAMRVPYVILVQAGYFIGKGDAADLRASYSAAQAIWCVSDDTADCVRMAYPAAAAKVRRFHVAVDAARFRPLKKENWIAYLPSKMPRHAQLLRLFADPHLPPGWQWKPIGGLSEPAVADLLGRSRIFVALAELEGFGLPPLEAAFAGNEVIGYHAQGGREFWQAAPFTAVAQGDIPLLARTLVNTAERLSQTPYSTGIVTDALATLKARYSEAGLIDDLAALTNELKAETSG